MFTRNLISFSFARGFFFFFLLGNVVTEFAEIDDFADWRLRSRRDFDEIQSEALRFSQGVRQFYHAQLLAGGS